MDQPPPSAPPPRAYLEAAGRGLDYTTRQIEASHQAVADLVFKPLRRLPLAGGLVGGIQAVHDSVLRGSYAACRLGGLGLLRLAGRLRGADRAGSGPASAIQGALNGAFGDTLQQQGSELAFDMALYRAGQTQALSPAEVAIELAAHRGRLCVFIHGLALDERCWQDGEPDYGAELHAQHGWLPLYLRYNSGLPLATNGAALARLLDEWARALPQLTALVLVGHSMGGLLARAACQAAQRQGQGWLTRLRGVACLGSPHLGAPLERLGRLLTVALQVSKVASPLAELALLRSQGVQDLRHGLRDAAHADTTPVLPPGVPHCFIASSLLQDASHPASAMLGDGLVPLASASDPQLGGDIERITLAGIGHMALLRHPRVYAELARWLASKHTY